MSPETAGSPLQPVLFLYLPLMLIFYFLILKPQKDKQKEQKQMLANLKKNDQVVTAGGIHGTIINVKDTSVVMRIDDNVKVEVDKDAITTIKKT